jgi:hypothetical protein
MGAKLSTNLKLTIMNKETRNFVWGLILLFGFGRAAAFAIFIISKSETNGPWYEWIFLILFIVMMYRGYKLITKNI